MFLKVPSNSRYEIKFITYQHNYHYLINWLKLHQFNFQREYNSRIVNNIYFDSLNYDSFKANIFGDSSRIKTRFRWYGNLDSSKNGKFEIKYKRNLYGWKNRYIVENFDLSQKKNWAELINIIWESLPDKERLNFEGCLYPKIINQYHRDYFKSYNGKIRVTLDKENYVFDQRFYKFPNLLNKIITQSTVVMEFKFDRDEKGHLKNLIKSVPIRSSRNSKYINSIRAVTGN